MLVEFDPAKGAINLQKHGISLARFADMNEASIRLTPSAKETGEIRYVVFGLIDDRLHQAVITFRRNARRVISLRRANRREHARYAQLIAG